MKTDEQLKGIFISITLVNLVVFILTFGGHNWIGGLLGNSYLYTLKSNQYYRLISCVFLHYGIFHLIGNSIALFIIDMLTLGLINRKDKYFIYFITGVLSSLSSALFNMVFHRQIISAGASGAICGLTGAFTAIAIGSKCKSKHSILYLLVPLLIIGISPGVDNIAHISGLVFGFLIGKLAVSNRL